LKHISTNKDNYSSLNSSLILSLGITVALTSSFSNQKQAEATIPKILSSPILNQNLNPRSNQENNSLFIPVSSQSEQQINSLPVQNKIAVKLEPLVKSKNNSELKVPVVLAPIDKFVHKVQPGETLDKIAVKYESSRQKLIQENQISNPNFLKVHQKLTIPSDQVLQSKKLPLSDSSTTNIDQKIQQQSSLYVEKLKADVNKLRQEYQPNAMEIAQNTAIPVAAYDDEELITDSRIQQSAGLPIQLEDGRNNPGKVIQQNVVPQEIAQSTGNIIATTPTPSERLNPFLQTGIGETVSPDLPPLGNSEQYLPNTPKFGGYIWPAKGVFTSGYGWRWGRMHRGIDIAGPVGTPILASAEGEVVTAGWNSGGYGNLVKLKHPDGSISLYAHNRRLLVRNGQKVEQGQRIADMGNTGRSTGPHLHFEIHPNGRGAINPIALLPKRK
jgi:murein DD-endopeptidase MepM/ murein hydrolase activator NlpD